MVVAKTENALTHLAKQFFDRTTFRRYQALVWGDVLENEGMPKNMNSRSPKRKVNSLLMMIKEKSNYALQGNRTIWLCHID